MAIDKTRRLSPTVLAQDLDAFAALQAIVGYTPANPAFTVEPHSGKYCYSVRNLILCR